MPSRNPARFAVLVALSLGLMVGCSDAESPSAQGGPNLPLPVAAAPSLSIQAILYEDDLGTLPAGGDSRATAINAFRQITGYSGPPGQARAFLWSPPGPMVDLGTLGGQSFGHDLNDAGEVVGTTNTTFTPFLYDPPGPMVGLTKLSGFESEANGINEAGVIVGGAENPALQPVVWMTPDDPMDIDPVQYGLGSAYDVNESNVVVGYHSVNNKLVAFEWTQGGGIQSLAGLAAGQPSRAYAVNDAGRIVGYALTAGGDRHAVLWLSASVGPIDLGTLGGDWSEAEDVNDEGTIAGTARTAAGIPRAYRRSAGGGITVLSTFGGDSTWAYGIGPTGHVVGAAETAGGAIHAVVWWYYKFANTFACACSLPQFPDPVKPTVVRLTVLGTAELDVRRLDPTTLRLGDGVEPDAPVLHHGAHQAVRYSDTNGDGRIDLTAAFDTGMLMRNGDLGHGTRDLLFTGILRDRSNAVTAIWHAHRRH